MISHAIFTEDVDKCLDPIDSLCFDSSVHILNRYI